MATDPWDEITVKTSATDPWAALAIQRTPPQVSPGETFANRGVNAIPLGNTLVNALVALRNRDKGERSRLTPQARAELEAMGEQEIRAPEPAGLLDTYRTVRDTRRERTEAGSQQNPRAAAAGTALGVVSSALAPLPKASVGGGLGGRLGSAALTGAGYGALDALEHGEADLTRGEFGQGAKDAARGAAVGAGLGLAAGGVSEGLARVLPGALRRLAISEGRQHIQGGSDVMAVGRVPLSDEAVEEVLQRNLIRPLATTEGTYPRIEAAAQEQGRIYGAIVDELESLGVRGPRVKELADELYARFLETNAVTSANKAPANVFRDEAANIRDLAYPAGGAIADDGARVVEGPPAARLGLSQAERLKQRLQDDARFDKRNPTGKEESLRETASRVRQANEDAITEAAMVPGVNPRVQELGAQFVPQKGIVGRLLEAEEAGSRGSVKALGRNPVNLKDTATGAAIATSMGAPILTGPLAALNSAVRRRTGGTVATESYALADALRSGRAGANLARGVDAGLTEAVEGSQDYADANADDPTLDPLVAALLRALRRKKD